MDFGADPAAVDPAAAPADDKMPFDKEPFNAGVEADEAQDPKKFIEQLSGKLGQSLRKYASEQGQPDFKTEKFAINSVLSATHTSEMSPQDRDDIIKKVNSSGQGDDPQGGEEAPAAEPEANDNSLPKPESDGPPADEKQTDEQTLVEMSLQDVNAQKLLMLYKQGGDARKKLVRLITLTDNYDDARGFAQALRDHVDYEDLKYIYDRLKEEGVQIPADVEEPVMAETKPEGRVEGTPKGTPKVIPIAVTENKLDNSEKLRIFESKTNNMTLTQQPEVRPETKPTTAPTTTPSEPSRRDAPFLPNVTPGVQPDPKAQA